MKDKAIIVCDNCGKEIKDFRIQEDKLNNGKVIHSYIRCPKCHKIFTILLEDEEIRKMKKEYKKLLDDHIELMNSKAPLEEVKISYNKLKVFVAQVKNISKTLEQKYLGGNDE